VNPGIYRDVPMAEYHRWPGVNFSKLKLFERSPAHAREEMLHPKLPTEAQDLGTAVHSAVLEPDRFAADYVVGPDCGRKSKIDKDAWAEFEARNPTALILDADDAEVCRGVSASVWAHPVMRELLTSKGASELCIVWYDATTGLRCKARIDRLGIVAGWSVLADLKTAGDGLTDASPDGFAKACARYLYHVQAAHYLAGMAALHERDRKFWHLACEKSAPFACAVYELSEGALAQGEQQRQRWLHRFAECERTENWPGYPTHVQPLDLPRWAQEEIA
jgi:PDDEXK-like domain of unknown function (DUF3799)